MELHLVHFNSMYGSSLAEAMNKSSAYDTVAVIGILFEIQHEDNPNMEPITEGIKPGGLEARPVLKSGLPDFSWYMIPNPGKCTKMNTKCSKSP
jgi:hypothetical protein